jgi:hypothetical protein
MQWKVVKLNNKSKKFSKKLEKTLTKFYRKGFLPEVVDLERGILIGRRTGRPLPLPPLPPIPSNMFNTVGGPETQSEGKLESKLTASYVSNVLSVMLKSPTEAQGIQFAQMTAKNMLGSCSVKELHVISEDIDRIINLHAERHENSNVSADDCPDMRCIKVAKQMVDDIIDSRPMS